MALASSVLICGAANAASSFDGFYAGAILNGHTASISDFRDASNELFTHTSDTNYSPSLYAGYGATILNNIYLGAELNFSQEGVKYTSTEYRLNGSRSLSKVKQETTKTLGFKLGYLFTENLLTSIKYKRGDSDASASHTLCDKSGCVANGSVSANGALDVQTIALGVDYKIASNIFATVEIGKTTPTSPNIAERGNPAFYNFGAGLGYRF